MLAGDAPFTPTFQLESSSGLVANAGLASQWQDLSGSANHLFASAAERPLVGVVQTPTGMPAVSFDGIDDRLIRDLGDGSLTGLPSDNADRSMFLVAQFHDATASGGATYGRFGVNRQFGLGVALDAEGGDLALIAGSDAGVTSDHGAFDQNTGTTGWVVLSAVHQDDGSSPADNQFLYRNGIQIATGSGILSTKTNVTSSFAGKTKSRVVMGQDARSLGHIRFDVAAWLVYDVAFGTADRQAVESYLLQTYLGGSLPNIPPIAVDDDVALLDGETIDIPVLANDSDVDGSLDASSVTIVDPPIQGTIDSIDATTGVVRYSHNASGLSDSFTYTVADGEGTPSNVATVTIEPPNIPPLASDDTADVPLGSSVVVDVLGNDSDSDGTLDPSSVTIVEQPAHAANVEVDPISGVITYTNAGVTLPDSFTYTVNDNEGATSNVATVSLSRVFVAPVAVDDLATISVGETVVIDLLANDSDVDGVIDPTTVVVVDQPLHATTISINPVTGAATYQHDGVTLPDSFTYAVMDNDGNLSNTATATIELPNTNPVAVDDTVYVGVAGTVLIDVLLNDDRSNGPIDPGSVSIVDQPASTASLLVDAETGAITYVHDGSALPDSFTYTVSAQAGGESNVATVTVRDIAVPPVVPGLSLQLQSDTGLTLSTGNTVAQWLDASGLDNHLSAAGDPQLAANATPSGAAAIVFDGDGDKLERLQPQGIFGLPGGGQDRTVVAVVNYIDNQSNQGGVSYGKGSANRSFSLVTDPGSGALSVHGWNAPNNIVSSTPGQGAGWLLQTAVLSNDHLSHFADGVLIDSWTHQYQTRLDAPASKIVLGESINGVGQSEIEIGAVFIYDRALSSPERTLVENYLATKYLASNVAPVAEDDFEQLAVGGSAQLDILSNDSDADSSLDRTTLEIIDQPQQASSFSVDPASGIVSYTHNGGPLPDSFTYRVRDIFGAVSNLATVYIVSPDAGPNAVDDSATLFLGGSVAIDVLGNDISTTETLDPTTVAIVDQPSSSHSISIDPESGAVTYVNDGVTLPDSFTYTVADNFGVVSNVATVNLTQINQAPVAGDDLAEVVLGGTVVIDVLENDSDADGSLDPTTVTIIDPPSAASDITIDAVTGEVTYTSSGSTLPDSFTYSVRDNDGELSNVAIVTLERAIAPQDVYFVGNSLTFGLRLPEALRPLANQQYRGLSNAYVDRNDFAQIVGGASLYRHWYHKKPGTVPAEYYIDDFGPELSNHAWDTLVLQPHGRLPEFFQTDPLPVDPDSETWQPPPREEGSLAMSNNFINMATHNADLRVVIYQTWPTAPTLPSGIPDSAGFDFKTAWDDQSGTEMRTRDSFVELVQGLRQAWDGTLSSPIVLAPAGDVMYELNQRLRSQPFIDADGQVYDDIEDFYADHVHLKAGIGRYLMAMTIYTVLYREDPRGLPIGNYNDVSIYQSQFQDSFVPVSPAMQQLIQTVVWDVVSTHAYTGWRPLVANDDSSITTLGGTAVIDVLANDTHSDGMIDPTSVSIVDQPQHASSILVDPSTGEVTYVNDGSLLPDWFTYTVQDNQGEVSNPATVTIKPPNAPPVAVDDAAVVSLGGTVVIDVLSNDVDSDGALDPLSVMIVDQPASAASLVVDAISGTITYTNDGVTLPDSFSYTVRDDSGNLSDVATVSVTEISGPPDGPPPFSPVLQLESFFGIQQQDGLVSAWNDQSGLDNHLFSSGGERPELGSTNTPTGAPSIRFDGVDDRLLRHLGDGPISLPAINESRTMFLVTQIHNAGADAGAGYGRSGILKGFGLGATEEGEFALLAESEHLTSQQLAFQPPGNTNGWVVLTAVHQDDGSAPADNGFLFVNGSEVASWNQELNTRTNVTSLSNGHTKSRIVVGQPLQGNGHVELDVAAWLIYDEALEASQRQQVESYLTKTYLDADTPPLPLFARDDQLLGTADTLLNFNELMLTQNDDLGSQPTTVSSIDTSTTMGGTVDVGIDTFTYAPPAGFTGVDTFSYTITDALMEASSAVVSVTVNPDINEAPTPVDDTYSISSGSLTTALYPMADNGNGPDTDPDGDSLFLDSVELPNKGGHVIIRDNGTPGDMSDDYLDYTPAPGFEGIETFNYVVSDGNLQSMATIIVVLNPMTAITPTQPIQLFDGSSLSGFYSFHSNWGIEDEPNSAGFTIENGLIRVAGDIEYAAMISEQSYRDYILVVDFKWGDATYGGRATKAKNAGLFIHSDGLEGSWQGRMKPGVEFELVEGGFGDIILLNGVDELDQPVGYSMQANVSQVACTFDNWMCRGGFVWDPNQPAMTFDADEAHVHWDGWDPDWQDRIGFRGDTVIESPDGEWNQLVIVADGDRIEFFVNGRQVSEAFGLGISAGQIQLQLERAEYFVRRVELLPLGTPIGPFVISQNLPRGEADVSYQTAIETRGGTLPLQYQVSGGSLPPGLSLDPDTGEVSGTPSAEGEWQFQLQITDADGVQVSEDISLVINDGLLAIYEFDETSGTTVHDTSSNDHHLEIENADNVTWGNGTLTIDAATTISSITPTSDLASGIVATNELTIEAWIQAATVSTGQTRIMTLSSGPTRANFMIGTAGDAYEVRLRTTTNNLNGNAPSTDAPAGSVTTDRSHIVSTRTADGLSSIYVNGVLVASQVIDGVFSNWDPAYALWLGNEADSSRPWLGTFDKVAIYDKAWTAAEVVDNYFASL